MHDPKFLRNKGDEKKNLKEEDEYVKEINIGEEDEFE